MNSNIDSFIQDSNNSSNSATYNFVPESVDVENVRVSAAHEIRRIDLQLKKISELTDFMQLQYIGSTIDALNESGLPQNLQEIESKLVEARSKYTDEDRSIKRFIKQRDLAIEILKIGQLITLKLKN